MDGAKNLLNALEKVAIEWIVVVPASGLAPIYLDYERRNRCISVTREEEAIAVAAGFAVSDRRVAVVIQQAGVGNCLNAVFTLADAYALYFPIVVWDRGEKDDNAVQRESSVRTGGLGLCDRNTIIDWTTKVATQHFESLYEAKQRWIFGRYK
jgi:sulfopyruvate decarboxylase TPP-binding subunit